MNKLFYIMLTIFSLALFVGCDPIVDVQNVNNTITSADQLQATVSQVMYNGYKTNKVYVHCTSPVNCQWTDGVNTMCSSDTALVLLIKGAQSITVNTMTLDGTLLSKDFNVTVDSMRYPVAPQYAFFCGSGAKSWTWADSNCFGNGGGTDTKPAWWILNPGDLAGQYTGKNLPADGLGASMQFVLKGKKLIKTSVGGATVTGKFTFDMTAGKAGWSIGTLTVTNTNILGGYDFNATGFTPWTVYNIISLDANKMVLGAQEHAPNSNYWYWVFKAK